MLEVPSGVRRLGTHQKGPSMLTTPRLPQNGPVQYFDGMISISIFN